MDNLIGDIMGELLVTEGRRIAYNNRYRPFKGFKREKGNNLNNMGSKDNET